MSHLNLENQLCFAVYSAAHAFTRFYKPLLGALGLTYPQYLVLLVLWEADAVTVSEIGARLSLDSGTLSPLLKRLETMGLVARRRDAEDERQVRVTLTDAGRAMRRDAERFPEHVAGAMACSVDEIVALRTELETLQRKLDAAVAG